jgi:hypothetical protein
MDLGTGEQESRGGEQESSLLQARSPSERPDNLTNLFASALSPTRDGGAIPSVASLASYISSALLRLVSF